ncbi:MAG TPA: hypothetical protein VGH67_00470 [Solirubrobacteraceae bacterium]
MPRAGIGRRLDLDQPLDLEAAVAQQGDHLAVGEVELDRWRPVRPGHPVHPKERPRQPLAGRHVLAFVGVAEHRRRNVSSAGQHATI